MQSQQRELSLHGSERTARGVELEQGNGRKHRQASSWPEGGGMPQTVRLTARLLMALRSCTEAQTVTVPWPIRVLCMPVSFPPSARTSVKPAGAKSAEMAGSG